MPPIVCWGSLLVFVLIFNTKYPFEFCNHPDEEERGLMALPLISFEGIVTVMLCGSSLGCYELFVSV